MLAVPRASAAGAVLLFCSAAFSADFNLPSAPLLSLTRGSNNTTVTYRGQTNFQFILYASSNSTSWIGLVTNLCTNAQMTVSETNRPTRFYKATSFKTPLIFTCTNEGPQNGAFAIFARTNDTFALVGYTASSAVVTGRGEFSNSLSIGNDNTFTGTVLAGRAGILQFTSNRISGTVTNGGTSANGRVSGNLTPDVGQLQAASGFYSGSFSGSCIGTLKAIVTADGTIFLFINDNIAGPDGGSAPILSNFSFTVVGVRGVGPHFTGTVNPVTKSISGQYIHGQCDGIGVGTFTMTRQEKVF